MVYNMQGRPNNYRGWNLAWKNGRVKTFAKSGLIYTCEYDANGIRVKKTANGLQHKYYLEDDRIVREVVTGSDSYELLYMYGANGIAGFTHIKGENKTNYYYRKNILGDIVAIYGENGTKYAEYVYDAWGNCTVFENDNGIANLNPFRYRGYYWDSEFGLYYLNARYYDPEVGRFISQDDISYLAPETLNGLNLFAYCLNNPVMAIDPDGCKLKWWHKLLIGIGAIVIGATITALTAGAGTPFLAAFGSAMLTSTIQVGISTAVSAGLGMIVGGISTGTWEGAFNGLIDGAVDGFMWGGILAGASQAIGGVMRGVNSYFGYAKTGKTLSGINAGPFRFLSPNKIYRGSEFGGTLLRVGQTTRYLSIDIGGRYALHMHTFFTGSMHIPLIPIIAPSLQFFS